MNRQRLGKRLRELEQDVARTAAYVAPAFHEHFPRGEGLLEHMAKTLDVLDGALPADDAMREELFAPLRSIIRPLPEGVEPHPQHATLRNVVELARDAGIIPPREELPA